MATWQAAVVLGKGFVGVGWMSVALGIKEAHLLGSVLGALVIAGVTAGGMLCLTEIHAEYVGRCKDEDLPARRDEVADSSQTAGTDEQEELAKEEGLDESAPLTAGFEGERYTSAELTYDELTRLALGPWACTVMQLCITISQLGTLMAYSIFMGVTGREFVPAIPHWAWCVIVFPVIAALCQLREITLLMDYAFLGAIAAVVSMLTVCVSCAQQTVDSGVAPMQTGIGISQFAKFFGIFFFSMEGIQVTLPVVHGMRNPEDAGLISKGVVGLVCCAYLVVGLLGYLAYGNGVLAPITENMDKDPVMDMVRLLMAACLLTTAPLQAFPVSEILDRSFPDSPRLVRLGVVLVPSTLAALFPYMADAMGVIGGVAMTLMGGVIPFFMYIRVFESSITPVRKWGLRITSVVMLIFGMLATVQSLADMFEEAEKDSN